MKLNPFDIAIVGAGIVGLAHAWMAARKGLKVVVIEKDPFCQGASVRNFGFVTVTGQRAGDTWNRARASRDLWLEIAQAANIDVCHQGLLVVGQRQSAGHVLESFKASEMGEDCELLSASEVARRYPEVRAQGIWGGLYSPHELRVESRVAIQQITRWLKETYDVCFVFEQELLEISLPLLRTAKTEIFADRLILATGTELSGIALPYIQDLAVSLTQLQMLRIQPRVGFKLQAAVMSDLSLVRYAGYTGLGAHSALLREIQAEHRQSLEAGIHLIAVQSLDGSLVVGDSHHPAEITGPFAQESVDQLILSHLEETLNLDAYSVTERWTGRYPVMPGNQDALILTPTPDMRVVSIVSGTGASTAFGIAQEVMNHW